MRHDGALFHTLTRATALPMIRGATLRWCVAAALLLTLAASSLLLLDGVHAPAVPAVLLPRQAPVDKFSVDNARDRLDDPLGRWGNATAADGSSTVAKRPAPLCYNSCSKAGDGVCDEGRRGNLTIADGTNAVLCDLGTDCDVSGQ